MNCVHLANLQPERALCALKGWGDCDRCTTCHDRVEGSFVPPLEVIQDPPVRRMNWSEELPCAMRGLRQSEESCGCGGVDQVPLFRCRENGGLCCLLQSSSVRVRSKNRELQDLRSCEECPARQDYSARRKWITNAELVADTLSLIPKLTGYDSIIGVARSGLTPATLLAQMLHRPLYLLRQTDGDIIHAGHGWRLSGQSLALGRALLVDDTIGSGVSIKRALDITNRLRVDCNSCVIYQHPEAEYQATHCAQYLPNPHVLEWNVGNSPYSDRIVWDMDGLICEDCPPECDDDGHRYLDWMRSVKPKCLTRRSRITIATGRREKWRSETLAWLDRHGIQATLRMHADGVRTFESIVSHKSQICENFPEAAPHGTDHAIAMLESDLLQAQAIERRIGRPVWHC